MATIRRFEEIESWKKARELCNSVCKLIDEERFKRNYRLVGQIEGFERGGNKEFIQFLSVAKGSCGEFTSQLYRALDRSYLNDSDFEFLYKLSVHVSSMIQKLINYLQNTEMKGTKYKKL